MKRRGVLGLLSAAAVLPVLPATTTKGAAHAARGGYAKLLSGWATYHVETGGVTTAAGLAPRLGVSTARAQGILSNLTLRGVLGRSALRTRIKMKQAAKHLLAPSPDTPTTPQDAASETDNGKIHDT